MGGSGPRGTRTAPVERTEGEGGENENEDDEGGEGEGGVDEGGEGEGNEGDNVDEGSSGTNYGYRSSISSDRAAAAKLAGGSGKIASLVCVDAFLDIGILTFHNILFVTSELSLYIVFIIKFTFCGYGIVVYTYP